MHVPSTAKWRAAMFKGDPPSRVSPDQWFHWWIADEIMEELGYLRWYSVIETPKGHTVQPVDAGINIYCDYLVSERCGRHYVEFGRSGWVTHYRFWSDEFKPWSSKALFSCDCSWQTDADVRAGIGDWIMQCQRMAIEAENEAERKGGNVT